MLIREDCRLAHTRFPSPIGLTVRSTHFGTGVPLPEMDVRTMMVLVIRYASYRSARGIRKTDVKEMDIKMNLKKALFVGMLSILTLPAIASAKPLREGHDVTPARKAHFAKLHSGR